MNWDSSNTIKRVLLGVSILINLIILIYAIQKIGYTSEFAGSLINLGHKIEITIIGIGLTSFCYLIVQLIF